MSTIRAANIGPLTGSTDTISNIFSGTCKSWVNFNGNGSATARASFNVSSLTYHTTGQYSVSFTTNMTDANYVPLNTAGPNNDGVGGVFGESASYNSITTSTVRISYIVHSGSIVNTSWCFVAVFR